MTEEQFNPTDDAAPQDAAVEPGQALQDAADALTSAAAALQDAAGSLSDAVEGAVEDGGGDGGAPPAGADGS